MKRRQLGNLSRHSSQTRQTPTNRLRCILTLPTFFPCPPMSGSSSCWSWLLCGIPSVAMCTTDDGQVISILRCRTPLTNALRPVCPSVLCCQSASFAWKQAVGVQATRVPRRSRPGRLCGQRHITQYMSLSPCHGEEGVFARVRVQPQPETSATVCRAACSDGSQPSFQLFVNSLKFVGAQCCLVQGPVLLQNVGLLEAMEIPDLKHFFCHLLVETSADFGLRQIPKAHPDTEVTENSRVPPMLGFWPVLCPRWNEQSLVVTTHTVSFPELRLSSLVRVSAD